MLMEEWFSDGFAVQVPAGTSILDAELQLPPGSASLILLAHAGGGRKSRTRLQGATEAFAREGYATLVIDLLTEEEGELDDLADGANFEADMLAERLEGSVEWLLDQPETASLPIGIYGFGAGGRAGLATAGSRPKEISALVIASLALEGALPHLGHVMAPTLLIAAERDVRGMALSRQCLDSLTGRKRLEIVHGTGTIGLVQDKVSRLACLWFEQYLNP